ncbi:MAG: DUF4139 domain-containing protein, partial [Hormoscilla sp.]
KVYASGATVSRLAELQQADEQVEIAGLPLALDTRSVRVRVETESDQNAARATDVRVGLAVPEVVDPEKPPAESQLRQAQKEVQRLENIIALIDNEIEVLYHLGVPDRPPGEKDKAPPPSPLNSRLALANFQDEQVRSRIAEKRETTEQLRLAQEHYDELRQKQMLASTGREAKSHELRKTVVVKLSYEGVTAVAGQRLLVEYFVPGALWTPTYVCSLDSGNNTASIAVRALICQRTGEDWSGVSLELSTALPQAWCELPELPSLRLGRAQPTIEKAGWRFPPVGAEILFADFDRYKETASLAAAKTDAIAPLPIREPELPELRRTVQRKSERAKKQEARDPFVSFASLGPTVASPSPRMTRRAKLEEKLDLNIDLTVERAASKRGGPGARRVERAASKRDPAASPGDRETVVTDFLAYGMMRMGAAKNKQRRGKLEIPSQEEVYIEILKRQQVTVNFDVLEVIREAFAEAHCVNVSLLIGRRDVRQVAGDFDYAYNGEGRVDVVSDGQFHSVALRSNSAEVDLRYVVVPRIEENVFRIAQLRNPLPAPLLAGPADVYVDGEYILSTNIATVPAKGQMELGLGVEQGIKVARNTTYKEARSGETLVSFNELRHHVTIDIANRLSRNAKIEVRDRLPIPEQDAKVDVVVERVSPAWEKYEQEERDAPIKGGYRWQVEVPAGEEKRLSVDYTIKTLVDNEVVGGNRREE